MAEPTSEGMNPATTVRIVAPARRAPCVLSCCTDPLRSGASMTTEAAVAQPGGACPERPRSARARGRGQQHGAPIAHALLAASSQHSVSIPMTCVCTCLPWGGQPEVPQRSHLLKLRTRRTAPCETQRAR